MERRASRRCSTHFSSCRSMPQGMHLALMDKWAYFFREAKNLEVGAPPALSEGPFREALEVAPGRQWASGGGGGKPTTAPRWRSRCAGSTSLARKEALAGGSHRGAARRPNGIRSCCLRAEGCLSPTDELAHVAGCADAAVGDHGSSARWSPRPRMTFSPKSPRKAGNRLDLLDREREPGAPRAIRVRWNARTVPARQKTAPTALRRERIPSVCKVLPGAVSLFPHTRSSIHAHIHLFAWSVKRLRAPRASYQLLRLNSHAQDSASWCHKLDSSTSKRLRVWRPRFASHRDSACSDELSQHNQNLSRACEILSSHATRKHLHA